VTTSERPPHYARVRALLGALDAPVVQLWGWPGTGKRAILRGLLEDDSGAEYLPAAWLAAPLKLEERLRRMIGRRPSLLVCEDDGDAVSIAAVAALLRPGQRLLVAGGRRLELAGRSLATSPPQLLLRPDEIRRLWRSAAGRSLTAAEVDRLLDRSGGWLLPLALWAHDPAIAGSRLDDGDHLTVEPLAVFLRERVLGPLEPSEQELLRELAARGAESWEAVVSRGDRSRREAILRGMIERVALPRVAGSRVDLPWPLAALLTLESRRSASGALDLEGARSATATAACVSSSAVALAGEGTVHPSSAIGEPGASVAQRFDPRVATAPEVRIGLLGVPRVERRDPSGRLLPVVWSFKRPLRILAYLASAPDLQATREEIVSILWPEANEDAVRRNLHPAVSWLRRSVWPGRGQGGVVLLRDGVYSLDPTLHWEVDVRLFFERVEEGARNLARGRVEEAEASWEAAWRLYQGPFLQGWSDRWVLEQREELQLRFTDLLRRLGDLKARLGRLTEAEDAYRTLLLEDPLEEGVHVSIMRIYAARGRRDLVNRQYQRLRQVLVTELGVEPSPPTLEVFNELMLSETGSRYK